MLSNMKIDLSSNIMNIVSVSYRMHASIPPFITYAVRFAMQKSMCLAYVVECCLHRLSVCICTHINGTYKWIKDPKMAHICVPPAAQYAENRKAEADNRKQKAINTTNSSRKRQKGIEPHAQRYITTRFYIPKNQPHSHTYVYIK